MDRMEKTSLVKERFFPFEYSTSCGVEEGFRRLHWHRELEICRICEGTGTYLINGIEYAFSQGDIFVIGNNDIHLCCDDVHLIMQVFMFDPGFLQSGHATPFDYEYLRPLLETSEQYPRKISRLDPINPQLTDLLLQMESEYTKEMNGYDLMIKALLLQFLALLIRHCMTRQNGCARRISSKAAEKIRGIILHLETHYAEEITLHQLSEAFRISVPYLCSTFKAFTGSSPVDYLIKYRILMAKAMLDSTDKPVIAVSEDCGFGSLSNFNHLFKALTGFSPTEYRKGLGKHSRVSDSA